MTKEQAKQAIQRLVEKFETIKAQGKLLKYSEEQTKKDFILPLFEALGWKVYEGDEVTAEEQISNDRVDYGFYLNGRIKFYLEAKKIAADLHREEFAKQAIKYSWNKGVTWAVLTDFESLIVFNALSSEKSLAGKRFFEIPYTQYLERFDQLWLLSKEAFSTDQLDTEAEKVGKKLAKISVSDQLYKDLNECRTVLTKAFISWNPKVDRNLIDEGVQKLIDRLIFIRVAEDRKIEPATLRPLLNQWVANKRQGSPFAAMVKKFRELDAVYNSNLFSEHPFEKWDEFEGATEKVIEILEGQHNYLEYDFSVIPADVLGAVYENYLGYKLQQSKTDLFGKDVELSKDSKKRKEQGIYYTPKFIVDYIVGNSLGPVLDRCKSIGDLKKIKVLDPACGSGSFLVAAFNFILKKYEEFGARPDPFLKIQILNNNIYGVDLDEQAVELARLNLLLNTFDGQFKLPNLGHNIKNGNSLICGTDEELTKYFGPDFRSKKPFNWQEEFPEVFNQGGFDCIIGNPPYGAELTKEEQNFFKDRYDIGSTDTAILFIKKSLTELKSGGNLGFIIPKAFTFASNYEKVRGLVWDGIEAIIDGSKVWKEVKLEQVIIIVVKDINYKIYKSGLAKDNQILITGEIDKKIAKSFGFFLNDLSQKEIKIGQKIFKSGGFLGEFIKNKRGVILNKFVEGGKFPVIGGKEIDRFKIKNIRGYINDDLSQTTAKIEKNSILVQGIVAHIENPIDHIKITANIPDSTKYFIADNINQIVPKGNITNYFIWALLNSQLLNWYCYRFIYGKSIRTMRFDNPVTDTFSKQ